MHSQVLTERTKNTLALLVASKILPVRAYLAGGTAIALHLGHRISLDLDFFTPQQFQTEEVLESLKKIQKFKLSKTDWGTILGDFPSVKFSLFYYQYPLIEKTVNYQGIAVAGLKDLITSKIGAISSRGTKRDFIDLYYILKENSARSHLLKSGRVNSLEDCLAYYNQRFQNLAGQKVHILKSLTYFEDANKEEDPNMLVSDYSWGEVKKFLISEVEKLI